MPSPQLEATWCREALKARQLERPFELTRELSALIARMQFAGVEPADIHRHPAVQLIVARLADTCDITLRWPKDAESHCSAMALLHPPAAANA